MTLIALVTLLLALILDFTLGEPPNRFHLVAAMGSFIHWLAKLTPKSSPLLQFLFGALVIITGGILFALPLIGLELLMRPYPLITVIVNAILLKMAFSLRRLLQAGNIVKIALESGNLPGARHAVAFHLVSRHTDTLDESHVASAVIESLAENLADSFVAPLLVFSIGGLPLAWFYRFVNTADAMIGYHNEKYEYLGKFAARLDDALNWIPARLAGLLIVLAAPAARNFRHLDWKAAKRAWQVMFAQHRRTASPNAGWPMSAAAGALGVVLEKTGCYRLEGGADFPAIQTIDDARRLILSASLMGFFIIIFLAWSLTYVP